MDLKPTIQKTLFGEEIIVEYYGLDIHGNTIKIPNFQPYDDNPRLDMENEEGKRKNKKKGDMDDRRIVGCTLQL